ncbi:MAG TPA: STT3 domain-containing protein, partial [Candidatus Binatus sp.]|nr:STT3 domain-containing protein [Candidatus Binatus sp.]
YPGTSFTGVAIYLFLNAIGANITLQQSAVYTPVLLGVFACIVTYYFARDIWGRSAGLLAALFLGFSSSLISRTSLGFFRNEAIGIPAMILAFLFFLRGIDNTRSLRATIIYAILSSLSLTFMAFSWGSFRYAVQVMGLFTLAMVLVRKYSPRLTLTYGITVGFFLLIGTGIPYLGRTFLEESTTLALVGIMGVLVLAEGMNQLRTSRERMFLVIGAVVGVFLAAIILPQSGIATNVGAKFLATINPFIRNNIPLVASVAENRPATWASFYLELGPLTLLGVFGLFIAFQRLRPADILVIIYGTTAFYFAASLVRLSLLLAPAISILAAMAVVGFARPALHIIQQASIFPRRGARFIQRINREAGLVYLGLILLIVMPPIVSAVDSAYTPVTIASSSLPTRGA